MNQIFKNYSWNKLREDLSNLHFCEQVLLAACLLIFGLQFYQSFAVSNSLDMVGNRGEDDGAFFPIVMKLYHYFFHLEIDNFITGSKVGEHYGYGWFFWVVSAAFALPGAAIRMIVGVDNFFTDRF